MMLADVVIQYFYYKLKWSEYLNISFLLAQSTQIYRVYDVCLLFCFETWDIECRSVWDDWSKKKISIEFYDTEKYVYDEDENAKLIMQVSVDTIISVFMLCCLPWNSTEIQIPSENVSHTRKVIDWICQKYVK